MSKVKDIKLADSYIDYLKPSIGYKVLYITKGSWAIYNPNTLMMLHNIDGVIDTYQYDSSEELKRILLKYEKRMSKSKKYTTFKIEGF